MKKISALAFEPVPEVVKPGEKVGPLTKEFVDFLLGGPIDAASAVGGNVELYQVKS
jgi:hypothetical protein